MKSEGSRFLDGEEEGGVTGNLSSLQTLRREGTSLTKRQMDYFALSTVNINPQNRTEGTKNTAVLFKATGFRFKYFKLSITS